MFLVTNENMGLCLYMVISEVKDRASNISNIGQGAITIIVTNQGGQSNHKKVHSQLLNSIRVSLVSVSLVYF